MNCLQHCGLLKYPKHEYALYLFDRSHYFDNGDVYLILVLIVTGDGTGIDTETNGPSRFDTGKSWLELS